MPVSEIRLLRIRIDTVLQPLCVALAVFSAASTVVIPRAAGAPVSAVTGSNSPGAARLHLVRIPGLGRIPRGGGRGGSGQSSQQRQYQKYLQRQQQAYIQQQQAEAAKLANAPPPEPTTGARGRQAQQQSLLKRFDANGDGKLSDAERRTAKTTLAKEKAAGGANPAGAAADPAANGENPGFGEPGPAAPPAKGKRRKAK